MAVVNFKRGIRGDARAESVIDIGASRSIRVTTFKGSRGVSCHAQVVQDEGDMFSFVMFQDWSKVLAGLGNKARATEKCILSTHDAGLFELPKYAAEIEAKYPGTKVVI